jgi:hypothetical protein
LRARYICQPTSYRSYAVSDSSSSRWLARKGRPTYLLDDQVDEDEERGVADSFGELLLALGGDVEALDVLLDLVKLGEAELVARARDKDLVTVDVASRGVVAAVRDTPRVVRDAADRMEDPSDSVVDRLTLRESLVTALVRDNPEACRGSQHHLVSQSGERWHDRLIRLTGSSKAGPEPEGVPEHE